MRERLLCVCNEYFLFLGSKVRLDQNNRIENNLKYLRGDISVKMKYLHRSIEFIYMVES